MADDVCPDCGHSLKDNKHGPDQNDYWYDDAVDGYRHSGTCTYCRECNKELTDGQYKHKHH